LSKILFDEEGVVAFTFDEEGVVAFTFDEEGVVAFTEEGVVAFTEEGVVAFMLLDSFLDLNITELEAPYYICKKLFILFFFFTKNILDYV